METLKIKLRQHVLIPLMAVLGILVAIVVFAEYMIEYHKLRDRHLEDVQRVQWILDRKVDEYALMCDILTRQLSEDPSLQQDFLAGDRERLLAQTRDRYEHLNHDYGITHFYFHQLDSTCFLRVHYPTRFGDPIDRQTLAGAVSLDKPCYGIELGPLGTLTFRYVSPWKVDGKVIGYLELGSEIDSALETIQKESGFELAVLIDKQFLNRKDFQDGRLMLERVANWDLFENAVIVSSTLKSFPKAAVDSIRRHSFGNVICTDTPRLKFEDNEYLSGCLGLTDVGGRTIGRIFCFLDITAQSEVIAQTSIFFGGMVVAAGILSGGFFHFYIGRIERRLRKTDMDQRIEIMHRRFAEAQLREAKERAESANIAKSQFLANMSHELRTPMNAIVGFTELLKEEPLTEEQLDYVETIFNSSGHLLTLINDVLDISKIEAGKLEISLETCSLRHILMQVDSMMRGVAETQGITFQTKITDSLPDRIVTDGKHLFQCLINLVGNAIKFTEKGHVIVRASDVRNTEISHIRLEIEDTGIGIPEDKQKIVFESFQQADAGTCRKYGGTGLGLTISRQLIELMGGTLMLQSEKGKGSTFTIMLPCECPIEQNSEIA